MNFENEFEIPNLNSVEIRLKVVNSTIFAQLFKSKNEERRPIHWSKDARGAGS